MISYALKIAGDQRVALRFDQFPDAAHDALVEKIRELTAELDSQVRALIPHKSGKLAGQVKSGVEERSNRIRGWVSLAGASASDVRKAAALEYGSTGRKFNVSGFTRQLDQVFGHMTEPFDQVVEAYRRAGGLTALNFMHGPFDAGAASVLDQLNAVFLEVVAKTEAE